MVSYLPSSGAISIDDIRTAWGSGGNQYNSISEFRGQTWWRQNDTSGTFPSSGSLSFSDFYDKGPTRRPIEVISRSVVQVYNTNNPDGSRSIDIGTAETGRVVIVLMGYDTDNTPWSAPSTVTLGGTTLNRVLNHVYDVGRATTLAVYMGVKNAGSGSQTLTWDGSGQGTYNAIAAISLRYVSTSNSVNASRYSQSQGASSITNSSVNCSDGSYVCSFVLYHDNNSFNLTSFTGVTFRDQGKVNEPHWAFGDKVLDGSTSTGSVTCPFPSAANYSNMVTFAVR